MNKEAKGAVSGLLGALRANPTVTKFMLGSGVVGAGIGGVGSGILGYRTGAKRTANAMASAFSDANARENSAMINAFTLANKNENRMLADSYLRKGYAMGLQHATAAKTAGEDFDPFIDELEKLGFSVKGMKVSPDALKRLAKGIGESYRSLGKGVSEAASLGAAKATKRVPSGMKHLRVKGMKEALKAGLPAAGISAAGIGGTGLLMRKKASDSEIAKVLLVEMEKDAAFPAALMSLAAPAAKTLGKSFAALGKGLRPAWAHLRATAGRGMPMAMRGEALKGAGRHVGRALTSTAARPAALTLGAAGLFGAGRVSNRQKAVTYYK